MVSNAHAEAFTFGDPIPVMDRRELFDYLRAGRPLVRTTDQHGWLARTYRAAVHHSSAIQVKRNILTSTFIPHRWLSKQAFSRFAQDFLVFGNAYLENA